MEYYDALCGNIMQYMYCKTSIIKGAISKHYFLYNRLKYTFSLKIYRPDGRLNYEIEDRIDELLNLENVKIVGVKQPTPGK